MRRRDEGTGSIGVSVRQRRGGTAAEVAAGFRPDGLGAVVNSSRGIIASFQPDDLQWEAAVEKATRATIAALAQATPMGRLAPPLA